MTRPSEAELIEALKPCPFCGATPHRGPGKVQHDQLHGEPFQNFSIWCPHSHAKVTRVNAEQAAADWNTRAEGGKGEAEVARAIEDVILRRLRENRIEGYTLEMSKEIARIAALTAPSQPASAARHGQFHHVTSAERDLCEICARQDQEEMDAASQPSTYEGKAEPVAFMARSPKGGTIFSVSEARAKDDAEDCYGEGNFTMTPLYAHPPSQPAPAVDREAIVELRSKFEYERYAMKHGPRAFSLRLTPHDVDVILRLLAQPSSEEGGKDAELVRELRDEAMRLSGRSLDRGCVDSGIASNLADRAADRIESLLGGQQ